MEGAKVRQVVLGKIDKMKTQVVHCEKDDFDVYIGRGGPWGNPFKIGVHGKRKQVVEMYREWVVQQPKLMALLRTLKGKRLGCYCVPALCHGHVLAELADAIPDETPEQEQCE